MMSRDQILDQVQGILVDLLDCDPEIVTWDADLINDLGADSLDFMELIMLIEEDFDIEVRDEEAEHCKTVGDIVDVIEGIRLG